MNGRWLIIVVIVAVGYGFLELTLHQMKIGDYARSPQRFELSQGGRTLVGGGRAGVKFLAAPFLRSAHVQVKCKQTEKRFELLPSKSTDEICGVRIKLLDFVPGGKVALEASWGAEPSPEPGPEPRPAKNETHPTNPETQPLTTKAPERPTESHDD